MVRSQLTLQGISTGLVLVGAIFLVALIWWIEERIDRRREAQLAEIDAATAGATEDSGDGDDVSVPFGAVRPTGTAAAQAEGLMRPIDTLAHPAEGLASPAAGLAQPAQTQEPVAEPQTRPAAPAAGWSWGGTSASPLATSAAAHASAPDVPLGAGWDTAPLGDVTAETGAREVAAPGQHRWDDWTPAAPRPVPEVAAAPEAAAVAAEATDVPAVEAAAAESEAKMPVAEPVPELPSAQQAPEPEPEPAAAAAEPAPEPEPEPENGAPHLTIRVTDRGMVHAEMSGEIEPVILEDLTAYAEALANAGGTAEILVSGNGGMGKLIATRAQRIMAEAGVEATIPD